MGQQLASLTHAPDAKEAAEDAGLAFTDTSMKNIAMLRMKRKLDPLVASYAPADAGTTPPRQGDAEPAAGAGAGQ